MARERLADLFPVEMAPTVQALAINQWQSRPRRVSKITILADPLENLPSARQTAVYMGRRLLAEVGETPRSPEAAPEVTILAGAEATRAAFTAGLARSDLLVYADHGDFIEGDVATSYLLLADGAWRAPDPIPMEIAPGSMQVLAACEVGARSTGEAVAAERAARSEGWKQRPSSPRPLG